MSDLPKIVALVPALNEADRIGDTVRAAMLIPNVTRVVVVDDGSTDNTGDAALAAGADRVVRLPHNCGKGAALNAGLAQTSEPILLLLDADLGSSAAEAHVLVAPVLAGETDMAIATFPHRTRGGGFGLAVGLARAGIRVLAGLIVTAPLSGQRCLRREIVDVAGGFETGFGVETALTIDAARHGFRIREVATEMSHRVTGRNWSGVMHRARQFRDIAVTLLSRALSHRTAAGGRPA